MTRIRLLQHLLVLLYLAITAAALLFTMARIRVPGFPQALVHMSYGMMAPYQGDVDYNDDLLAEGRSSDGAWHPIDLDPYFPVGFGEKNVRKHLRNFSAEHNIRVRKYAEFAWKLLVRERDRGTVYEALRLTWQEWPRSPGGYEYLRVPLFITSTPIITVTAP